MALATQPQNNQLAELAEASVSDPLLFVMAAYPWGEPGTILEHEEGPDAWQADFLEGIRAHLVAQYAPLRMATVSGHGVGKSCLTAWLVQWFMATRPHPQAVITANTGTQLATKTWREMAKWHQLSAFKALFSLTATKYAMIDAPETWFAAPVTWSKDRAEAFAGTHENHVLMIFDEASLIHDDIWETAEGAMTTPGAMWFAFGNGTRNTGRFKACFPGGQFAHRWETCHVDSRTAKKADQRQIQEWLDDYGEDSDFFRVRVRGLFARTGSLQFIGEDILALAHAREVVADQLAPVILGVDVARFGDDRSCIIARQGGRILAKRVYREFDTAQLGGHVIAAINEWHPQAVFVDADGLGAGTADHVRAMGYRSLVHDVHSAAKPRDPLQYENKRAEMWVDCKAWLATRASLREDKELSADLLAPEYGYNVRTGRLQIEAKSEIKKRTGLSPDCADALVYTFAEAVAPVSVARPWGQYRERGGTWMR